MATETRHSGTLRTDYEADRARLEELRPLTADTDILLHRLTEVSREMPYRDADGREGTLTPLLENHVLTVLADIRRKRLTGYGSTFADAQGTAAQARYARKLEQDVERWAARLEAYLRTAFAKGTTGSPAVQIANELHDRLTGALRTPDGEDNRRYYRMLRTVTAIQENADRYWQQATDSGDTEPALALLSAYLKNYASIAEAFNRRFASLPELYRREVLHAQPAEAVPDHAYLIITPSGKGFTLANGTAFSAGEDLIYKTTQEEYISPMRCVSVQAIRLDGKDLLLQPLHPEDTATAETLFTGGEALRTGWQIESPMLVLEEGRREVNILFPLNQPPSGSGTKQGFTVEYATAEGWTDAGATCEMSGDALTFSFTIARDGNAPTPCTPDLHGTETRYPALRILTTHENYPIWADGLESGGVQITVEVSGIRNFTFQSELGETDTTQPFAPFGMQAERGAWFLFGNEETGLKPLKEVTLTGTWQKLPETRSAFDQLYKDYPAADASAFRVKTAFQKDGKWRTCADWQALFDFDEKGCFKPARFVFGFPQSASFRNNAAGNGYGYTRDKDGFFRVTLESPAIGFGMAAYRNRFTEVMVHNSRCKEKDLWALPQEPPMPLLADVEMAYKAELAVPVQARSISPDGEHKVTPIMVAGVSEAPPREISGRLLPRFLTPNQLCFAFADAGGEKRVRMYLDTALPQDRLPYYRPRADVATAPEWQYWNGTEWQGIPAKDIAAEETAGLTQSGFVEIGFPQGIQAEWLNRSNRLWLRAALPEDTSACLALRGVWTNCIRVADNGGNGVSLPAGTIQGTVEEDPRIGSVAQPLPGFGGTPAGTEAQSAAHQTARFANRHRAVTQRDYEQILLEHFPEADLAQCLTLPRKDGGKGASEVCLVVFSRTEDSRYFLSPPWKLKEMERTLRQYAPACVKLRVANPVYEELTVRCTATLHFGVPDEGKVLSELAALVEGYFLPWRKDGGFPVPGQAFSAKELCSRLVNHEDLQRVTSLMINGKEYIGTGNGQEDTIRGKEAWSVLLPKVEVTLAAPDDGIGGNGIGSDFVIG